MSSTSILRIILSLSLIKCSFLLGCAAPGGVNVTEESPFSAGIKYAWVCSLLYSHTFGDVFSGWKINGKKIQLDLPSVGGSASCTLAGAEKRTSGLLHSKEDHDSIKVEGCPADRSVGGKKPRTSGDEGPSMTELSGYNSKREEFEIEYDNDAEQMLADMEFKETDSNAERELKLRVLCIYNKRLDER